jgi:hypothetical protein
MVLLIREENVNCEKASGTGASGLLVTNIRRLPVNIPQQLEDVSDMSDAALPFTLIQGIDGRTRYCLQSHEKRTGLLGSQINSQVQALARSRK